jgi:hypothetical protein
MRGTANGLRLAVLAAVTVWPSVAGAASSISGTVTFDGKPPLSSRSRWTPTPRAPRSTRHRAERDAGSSAAATPWGTSWCGSRRGSRPGRPSRSQTPVRLDQHGCQYKPHVMGIMVGQPTRSSTPTASSTTSTRFPRSTAIQQADAGDRQGGDHDVRQAGGDLPDQVRRPPWMSLRRRLHPSFLLGDEPGREVHDLGPRRRGPTRSPPGTRGWGRRRLRSRLRANDTKTQDFKFATPREVSDRENAA